MNRFNRSGAPGGPSGAASSSTGAGEGDTLTMSDAIAGHAARNKQRDGKAAAPGGFLAKASGAVGGAVSRIWGAATTAASGGATPRTAATTGGVANLRESSYTEGSGGRPPGGAQSCCNSSFKQRASAAGAESSGQPRSAREERTGKDSPKDSGSVIRRVHQPAPSEVTGAEGYRRASRVGGGSRVGDEAGRNMPGRRVNGGSFTARDGPARQYGGSFTNRGVVQGGGRRSSIDYETIDHDAWEAAMKEMRRANGDDEDEEDDGNRRSVIEGRARLPSEKASGTDSNSRMSSIESRYSSIENSRYSSVELGGDEFKGEAKRRASVAQLFANLEAAEAAKFTDAVDRAAEGTAEQAAARAEHSPDPSSGMGDRASRAADRSERSERTSYLGRRSEANRTSQFDRTGRLDVSAEDPAESSPALARRCDSRATTSAFPTASRDRIFLFVRHRTPSNAPTSNSAYTTAAAAGQDDPDKKRSVGPVASSLQNQLDKFDAMQDNDGNTPRSAREVGAGGRRRSSVTTAFRAAAAATSLQQGFQREDGAQQRRGSLANVPLGRRASMVIDPTAPTDAHGLPISAHAHQKKKDVRALPSRAHTRGSASRRVFLLSQVLKLHAAFAENTTNAAKAPSADRTKGPKPDTFKAVLKLYYPHASRPDLDEMESWVSEETESAKPRANSSERGPTDFTLEQRSEIRQLFACYSTHPQKESVTLRDLRIGWKETGLDFTEVDAIFRRIDSDRSGTLDIDEFTKLAAELNLYDQHDAADLLGSVNHSPANAHARAPCTLVDLWG